MTVSPSRRRRRVPRVPGRVAALCAGLGVALAAGGVAISIAWMSNLAQWLGFGVFFLGIVAVAAPTTLWVLARYGVLDAVEKSRDWMDSAPRSTSRRS